MHVELRHDVAERCDVELVRPQQRVERARDAIDFAEQEALIAYAAASSGARTPQLVATSELGPDAAILVYDHIEGPTLDDLQDAEITDELLIMYEGYVVERGPTDAILDDPMHPYTQALVASVHDPLAEAGTDNDTPAPAGACPYLNRCPHAMDQCHTMPDPVGAIHEVRCHLYGSGNQPPAAPNSPTPTNVNVTGAHP